MKISKIDKNLPSLFLIPKIASIVCLGVNACPPNLRDVSLIQSSSSEIKFCYGDVIS